MKENHSLALATIVASYIKRILEGKYDKLFELEIFKNLKGMEKKHKLIIEALIYFITAIAEQKINQDTFLSRTIGEVALDAGPELAKRLINGDNKSGSVIKDPRKKELISKLFELDPETMSQLVTRLKNSDQEDAKEILNTLNEPSFKKGLLGRVDDFIGEATAPLTERLERFIEENKEK